MSQRCWKSMGLECSSNRPLSSRYWESIFLSDWSVVELHLKTGRTPFDVNSVSLKTGQRFRVALKNRTGFYLKTGQCRHDPEALHLLHCRNEGVLGGLKEPSAPPFLGTYGPLSSLWFLFVTLVEPSLA